MKRIIFSKFHLVGGIFLILLSSFFLVSFIVHGIITHFEDFDLKLLGLCAFCIVMIFGGILMLTTRLVYDDEMITQNTWLFPGVPIKYESFVSGYTNFRLIQLRVFITSFSGIIPVYLPKKDYIDLCRRVYRKSPNCNFEDKFIKEALKGCETIG